MAVARIVTTHYLYKRPPRKQQTVPLAPNKPVVVSTTNRKLTRLRRAERTVDDGRETPPEIKVFLDRMIRPGGALPPEKP
jgi:hypothetical protein